MIYVGVDPGSKNGAWAVIAQSETDRTVKVYPWDDVFFVADMQALSRMGNGIVAAVEKVGAMPKQGISSTWHFAENYGYIQGTLSACGIPYQLVPPRKWKAEYSLSNDKSKSITVCHKLFPELSLRKTEKCRTDDNNLAEATLLAEYARRHFGEGNVE